MSELPPRTALGILARSFAVQGSWNYETLIGTGFAFTLLPALRWAYEGDPEGLKRAIERHAGVFNSHPYFATVAASAVARLEADRVPPEVIERFKNALRGSLGSLGDQLFWMTWRPATLLLALVLLLAGCAWWVAMAVFLVAYNAVHLPLRVWGVRIGARHGLQVGRILKEAPLQPFAGRAADAGAMLAGLALMLALRPTEPDLVRILVVLVGAGIGLWLGLRVRTVAGVALVATWTAALILGLTL